MAMKSLSQDHCPPRGLTATGPTDALGLFDQVEQVAHVGHWQICRTDLSELVCSDEMFRIFGLRLGSKPPDFAKNMDYYAREYRERFRECIERAVVDGESFSIEVTVVQPDGERRDVIIRTLEPSQVEDPSKLFGVIMDVTEYKNAEARARESESSFKMLVEGVADYAIYTLDADGFVTNWNTGAERIKGYSAAEIIGKHFSCFFTAGDVAAGMPWTILQTAKDGGPYLAEGQRIRKDGSTFWASVLLQAIRDERGNLVGFAKITRDITERKRAEFELRASEARYRMLADHSSDMVVHLDLDHRRRFVSPAVRDLLGYEPDDLIGTKPYDTVHPDDVEIYRKVFDRMTNGLVKRAICQQRYRRKDGSYLWAEATFVSLKDEKGAVSGFVGAVRDISERKESEDRALHMARHDSLTGLPNRVFIREKVDQAIKNSSSSGTNLAIFLVDLDRFKAFNDSFGHFTGDMLLNEVASRIKDAVKGVGTVGRLAGDEFVILIEDLKQAGLVETVAHDIISAVGAPMVIAGYGVTMGLSIGIAVGLEAGRNCDTLLKNADLALYRAKATGRRNFRIYEPMMDAAAQTRLLLEIDMRDAIALGGFELHYQPVVDTENGTIRGYEALMRWRHPVLGMIPPSVFIPIAEESGLIVHLGHWALREACRQAVTWPDDIFVAVNVSTIQFREPGLEASVVAALQSSGLPANRLELEITESVLIDGVESVTACLQKLKKSGLRIVLDDFGTGYSSLSYLRRFPFDKIKLDRSFVAEIEHPTTAAIVRSIVSLAEQLGAEIVAEGIETSQQHRLVRAARCSNCQGFLFGRPSPPHDVALREPMEANVA